MGLSVYCYARLLACGCSMHVDMVLASPIVTRDLEAIPPFRQITPHSEAVKRSLHAQHSLYHRPQIPLCRATVPGPASPAREARCRSIHVAGGDIRLGDVGIRLLPAQYRAEGAPQIIGAPGPM